MEKYIVLSNDLFYPSEHTYLLEGVRYKIVLENDISYFLTEKKLSLDKKYEGRIFKVDML